MRIVVGHDFYDSGMSHGRDERIVFVREKDRRLPVLDALKAGIQMPSILGPLQEAEGETDAIRRHYREQRKTYALGMYEVAVIFCGTRYNGLFLEASPRFWSLRGGQSAETFVWSFESANKWLSEYGMVLADPMRKTFKNDRDLSQAPSAYFNVRPLDSQRDKAALDFIIQNNITLLTFNGRDFKYDRAAYWKVNAPNLAKMEFYKAIDAFQAFQKIEMWVGGVLPSSGRPMVEITDDKIKLAKHGFDNWSFRKKGAGR